MSTRAHDQSRSPHYTLMKVLQYRAGGSFGELALIFGTPRSATIRTTEPTAVWRVDRRTFRHASAQAAAEAEQSKMVALDNVRMLRLLTYAQKISLTEAVHELVVPAGSMVIERGDDKNVNLFYIIKEGEVEISDRCAYHDPGMTVVPKLPPTFLVGLPFQEVWVSPCTHHRYT